MGRFQWRRRGRGMPGHRDGSAGGSNVSEDGLLSEWREGDEALVVEVNGTSNLSARLRELGLTPGARIRVLRHGCPLVVQIGQGRLAMRRHDAAAVRLRAVSAGPDAPVAAPISAATGA